MKIGRKIPDMEPRKEGTEMQVRISESFDSFRRLRESGSYYADKTDMIRQYLTESFKSAVLFARPRRFGKSLTMTMFRDFLDIRQDSKVLFEGLKIMESPDVVAEYMNQYPVIFLSLKEVFGETFEIIFSHFRLAVANLCKSMEDLTDHSSVDLDDYTIFTHLKQQQADEANTIAFLDLLSRLLHAHYGKPVFVIIDEYDVPMAKALGTPAYDRVRDMIEHMLSYVCKTNDHVKAVMLSGCLYTVKTVPIPA